MSKLPLFPLNVVLFPGMPVSLHVFEDRYRLMVNRCLQSGAPFGVVLIRSGLEVGGPAETYGIGTSARLSRVERLPDGRFNIEAIGQDRFSIVALDRSEPYLSADVAPFPLTLSDSPQAFHAASRLLPRLLDYISMIGRASEASFKDLSIPRDPAAIAYLGAVIAQVPLPEKQALLSLASCADLLERERELYRRELPLLRHMLSTATEAGNEAFSRN